MKLPLTFRELEVGKLYTGCWFSHNQPVEDIWLQRGAVATKNMDNLNGVLGSLSCFVLLEKQEVPDREEEAMCRILTSTGDIGWATLVDGIHWFIEITGDKQ